MKKLNEKETEAIIDAVKEAERDTLTNGAIEEAVIVSADGSVRIGTYSAGGRSMAEDVWRGEAQEVYRICHQCENVWDMYDDPAEEFELCLAPERIEECREIIGVNGFSAPILSEAFPEEWQNFIDFAIDAAIEVLCPNVWQDDDGEITVTVDFNW